MTRRGWVVVVVALRLGTGAGVAEKAADLELVMPPVLHAVAGAGVSVCFDNVILSERPEAFRYEVRCAVGRVEGLRWTAVPEAAGRHEWTLVVRDEAGTVLEEGRMTLLVAAKDAGAGEKVRLLIVGDSLTHATHYPNELARLLSEPGNPQWEMIGTHRPASAKPGVAHEGYGGWKWADFLTRHDPKAAGVTAGPLAKKSTSPFLFADELGRVGLDLPRYFRENAGGKAPEVVTFLLGINDCFGANPEDGVVMGKKIDEVLDQAEKLLTAFREAAPEAALAVGLTTPPNARESGFEANYKGRYHRWGWKRIQHRLVRRMIERLGGRERDGIYLVATELGLDPVDGYPVNNGVHPNAAGYAQVGGAFYGWLKCWLADESKGFKLMR
jgi:lysophospholipase L1-like esterase